jgi:hypothetical protein
VKQISCVILIIYLGLSFFGVALGILEGGIESDKCKFYPRSRLAAAIPSFKLGCWLSEDI